MEKNKICNSLTLFTSESCNLNCKYCDIALHLNSKKHHEEVKKVKESFINGQYLNTIQTACEKLNIDKYNIKHLELWGQEPTLTLKEFNVMFPKLYKEYPNIYTLMFSTNGVSNINEIINLVLLLNNIVTQKFYLNIQFSFDGYEQTKKHRGIEPDIIINNIINFIEQLNTIELKLLEITIKPHNVIDKETFTFFANEKYEKDLYKYLKDFQNLYYLFLSKNNNNKVKIMTFGAGLEVPYNGSVENGKILSKFYKQCEKVGADLNVKNWQQLIGQFSRSSLDWNESEITYLLQEANQNHFIYNNDNKQKLKKLSNKLGCSYNYSVLKIRYDGTLIHCQNALYGLHTDNDLNNIDNLIQYRKNNKHYYANIFSDSKEDIQNYFYQTTLRHESSFLAAYIQTMTLLSLLLFSNQIDNKYNDIHNFLKCAYYLVYSIPCPHNSMMYSGSTFGTYCGWIRLLCNGFMDIVWDTNKKENKK